MCLQIIIDHFVYADLHCVMDFMIVGKFVVTIQLIFNSHGEVTRHRHTKMWSSIEKSLDTMKQFH